MKALLLDLDDTLLDDRGATRKAFSSFLASHRHTLESDVESVMLARWQSISRKHWPRFEQGEISFAEQRRSRVRDFLQQTMSDEEADTAFEPYLEAYEASWSLLPGVDHLLRQTASIPKVIVTNGERTQQLRKIEACGLTSHIVGAITPMDCGYWKPHRGIFLAALALLKVEPGDCWMIGDDPVRDIRPAEDLGMRAFLIEHENPEKSLLRVIGAD